MPPKLTSPRYKLVYANLERIKAAAAEHRASVALTGSVARGEDRDASEDHEASDIDLWVEDFIADDEMAPQLATRLSNAFKQILSPYSVDMRGVTRQGRPIPGFPVGPEHEKHMRRDAISIDQLPPP